MQRAPDLSVRKNLRELVVYLARGTCTNLNEKQRGGEYVRIRKLCHNGGVDRGNETRLKKQSEKGRQTSHGELHANESETICKRAFISWCETGRRRRGMDDRGWRDGRRQEAVSCAVERINECLRGIAGNCWFP